MCVYVSFSPLAARKGVAAASERAVVLRGGMCLSYSPLNLGCHAGAAFHHSTAVSPECPHGSSCTEDFCECHLLSILVAEVCL